MRESSSDHDHVGGLYCDDDDDDDGNEALMVTGTELMRMI